jgi:hypothetical protein
VVYGRSRLTLSHREPHTRCGFAAGVCRNSRRLRLVCDSPIPNYVKYTVTPPGLTESNENGISSIKPLSVNFSRSVAPLKQIEKQVTEGVEISPAIAGVWFWVNDRELRFTTRDDWPVGTTFSVRFADEGFMSEGVELEEYDFEFTTEPFSARITQSQFYQDPRDPNLKKLVATVQFTHPVDAPRLIS